MPRPRECLEVASPVENERYVCRSRGAEWSLCPGRVGTERLRYRAREGRRKVSRKASPYRAE